MRNGKCILIHIFRYRVDLARNMKTDGRRLVRHRPAAASASAAAPAACVSARCTALGSQDAPGRLRRRGRGRSRLPRSVAARARPAGEGDDDDGARTDRMADCCCPSQQESLRALAWRGATSLTARARALPRVHAFPRAPPPPCPLVCLLESARSGQTRVSEGREVERCEVTASGQ